MRPVQRPNFSAAAVVVSPVASSLAIFRIPQMIVCSLAVERWANWAFYLKAQVTLKRWSLPPMPSLHLR